MANRGAVLVAHGGGPTPVLNASLAGVVSEVHRRGEFSALYGARFGAKGLLAGDLIDLSSLDEATLERIAVAPGSVIGSSRYKVGEDDYERILDLCRRHDIHSLLYTGGNGSMETARRLHYAARDAGADLRVIGIPKTIDNDIPVTDHTPGYASCARFFAHAARDIGADNEALPSPVTVLEVLGRNVGWVVAGTVLARHVPDDPPHLVYLPEIPLGADRLCDDVMRVYDRLGRVVIAVCEGQKDEQGGWFGADLVTAPGARDQLPANMGHIIARTIWDRTGVRARAEKPGLLGRSCAPLASVVDRGESWQCGEAAVRAALEDRSGEMVSIRRVSTEPYHSEMELVSLDQVARTERPFPPEWVSPTRNDLQPEFIEWARPIVGEVAAHARL